MESTISGIYQAFAQEGIWMWVIMAVQITSVALIIERVAFLFFARAPKQKELARHIESEIKKGDLAQVISQTRRMGSNPIAAVARAGAQAAIDMGGREEIQSKMDEILLVENSRLEKRIGFLAMLGNVATLLGLLGTIVGMIRAFNSVGEIDPVAKSKLLTQGVALAMTATAYGLITALPALIMYAVLQNRANVLAEDLNQAALRIFNLLSFNFEAVPRSTPRRTQRG